MPAAAVISAPIAYIKVVGVKKLVVGFRRRASGPPSGARPVRLAARHWLRAAFPRWPRSAFPRRPRVLLIERARDSGRLL